MAKINKKLRNTKQQTPNNQIELSKPIDHQTESLKLTYYKGTALTQRTFQNT
jgi:hypothetical protein